MSQQRRGEMTGGLMRACVWLAAVGILVAGAKALESAVLGSMPRDEAKVVYIELRPIPEWMPKTLSRRIARSLGPRGMRFDDRALTATVYGLAEANPWVRSVHRVAKRRGDRPDRAHIEVQVEFRKPFAKVQRRQLRSHTYVDADGVVLPDPMADPQAPKWRAKVAAAGRKPKRWVYFAHENDIPSNLRAAAERMHYIIVQGVRSDPPVAGRAWQADDLADGLKLIALLGSRKYRDQITVVDVRNHGGRISPSEPQLRMFAQLGRGRRTDIRFGRLPVGPGDFVVPPERKMSYLDDWAGEHDGRLAGTCAWIDLRYDQVHHSLD